jgi:hypothetical protein
VYNEDVGEGIDIVILAIDVARNIAFFIERWYICGEGRRKT